jgi:protease II
LMDYCPYTNLTANSLHTHILIFSSIVDPRVPVSNSLKYTAKRRHYLAKQKSQVTEQQGDTVVVLDTQGGHFGNTGRFAKLREFAMECTFLIQSLKLPLD